jgi:small subunit ribosomal protein S5
MQSSREHRQSHRPPRDSSGFKEKVLDLRRVTRVVAGGKRFRFRATVVVGDEKGQVGIGVAKGIEVQQAVMKAKTKASKNMISIELKDGRTISHEVIAKYSAARVLLKPASAGHGLRAGGATRVVLAFAGIKDATAKALGRTPNKLTNAWATIEALKKIKKKGHRTQSAEHKVEQNQPQVPGPKS